MYGSTCVQPAAVLHPLAQSQQKRGPKSAGVCLPHSWQVVLGLQRGALAGNMPTVMMWRMCTSSNQQQATQVRPSLGGMLAAILLQKLPCKRQQVCHPQAAATGSAAVAEQHIHACAAAVGRVMLHFEVSLALVCRRPCSHGAS